MTLCPHELRAYYPALNAVSGRRAPPIYFDNAATALKPRPVIDVVTRYLSLNGANVHRGIHYLSSEGSEEYDEARNTVSAFVGADQDEIVFVPNTTAGINLVAQSFPASTRVLVTGMEHHSNLLPWRKRHHVRVLPTLTDGSLDKISLTEELEHGLDLIAICQISNVFGVKNPVEEVVALAHRFGTKVLVDGAQGAPHLPVDLKRMGCDFYVFSGHKLGSPTGIGVLFGTRERLSEITPAIWGGNMITAVHIESESLQDPPLCFEAGTPAIEATLGLAAACDFLEDVGLSDVWEHSIKLGRFAREALATLPRVSIHGPSSPEMQSGIVNFTVEGLPSNLIAKVLSDRSNVCVRSGYLCNQPMHEYLKIEPTTRASFYLYNTMEEVEVMISTLAELLSTA